LYVHAIKREAEFGCALSTAVMDSCGSASFDADPLGKITGLAGERQLLERAAEQNRRHPGGNSWATKCFPRASAFLE
jgi:hypothetical protein